MSNLSALADALGVSLAVLLEGEAVATVVSLTPSELAEFARHLVAASELQASWLIDALIIKLEVEPSAERHERIAAAILAGAGALE